MSDFLQLLKVNAEFAKRTVFKYLQYEDAPNELRSVAQKGLIACTSRTGSSLLQVSLQRYNLDAQEFFNPEGPPKRAYETAEAHSIADYANLLARTAISGDWFIAKGAVNSLVYLYYLNEVPEFVGDWKFIFLRRRNVVRQAISMEIAAITKQWTAHMPAQGKVEPHNYSFETLLRHVESVFAQNDRWERAFGLLGIAPYRLFYEDLVTDVPSSTENVARFLGIDTGQFPQAEAYVPNLQPQSTEINQEWEDRFRRQFTRSIGKRPIPQS